MFLYLISMFLCSDRLKKNTTWVQCTFSQKVGKSNPWFLWPVNIYLLQNIHKTMFCISKYLLIRYQLAPCCIGLGFGHLHMMHLSEAHDATPKTSWHSPSLVKQTGSHWTNGKDSLGVGNSMFFLEFSPPAKLGEMNPFWRTYFSGGLKPPTRKGFFSKLFFQGTCSVLGWILRGSQDLDVSG